MISNSGHLPEGDDLLTKEDIVKIKRCLYALQRDGLPPITTHNVINDAEDPVLNNIRRCHLFNTVNDRVKVRISCVTFSGVTNFSFVPCR